MSEKASRILLVIEALILCLPLSVLYLFAGLPATLYFLGDEVYEPVYLTIVTNTAIVFGIVSIWWLMGNFIIRGNRVLMDTSKTWWVIAGANAVFALTAVIYVTNVESYGPSSLLGFGWGIFFLPSYIHLLLERRRS